MRLLVCSLDDVASVNIRNRLLEMYQWTEKGLFRGRPILERGEDRIIIIEGLHLFADGLDLEMEEATGMDPSMVVFLSRHKAASGIPTLTVHPIGNHGKAEFGGREGTLVPSSPDLMTSTLRALRANASGLGFQISFEVTHHGPYLLAPTMFIEIGSSEENWGDRRAAEALARALIETRVLEAPKAIGVGGGHYAPRFSEVIDSKRISFGHMIPNYFCDHASDEMLLEAMRQAMANTQDARAVYIHKKSMSRSRATHIKELVRSIGGEAVDSGDLQDL